MRERHAQGLLLIWLGLLIVRPAWAAWHDLLAGPVELRFSETRVERLLVRDRYVFGDPHVYRRPCFAY